MDERLAARQAGILMPVASLPEGSFGQGSRRFVDLCVRAGFRIWQILPLGPLGYGNSPYQTLSSLAGDDIYIDLAALHEEGLLASLPPPFPAEEPARVDYNGLRRWREPFLREACRAFYEKGTDAAFTAFREKGWVYPWGVFMALKKQNGLVEWARWPEEQRDWPLRKDYDLAHLGEEIDFQIFLQYEFFRQWDALRRYANGKGLSIMGDVPFYVGHDSLDVWLDREDFLLDEHFAPTEVAGVPPDCFSNLGQRWGNPLYRWDRMEEKGFSFWVERIRAAGALCDIVRIDHFRAFDTYWAIPASCPTAVEGEWREAPGYALFDAVLAALPDICIVAEDLGDLRPEVLALRDHYGFMGMNIAEFTCAEPWKYEEHQILYPGNHDNEPAKSWYAALEGADKAAKKAVLDHYGFTHTPASQKLLRFVLRAEPRLAILPLWDILNLGHEARLNNPGTVGSPNWEWRLASLAPFARKIPTLRRELEVAGRI